MVWSRGVATRVYRYMYPPTIRLFLWTNNGVIAVSELIPQWVSSFIPPQNKFLGALMVCSRISRVRKRRLLSCGLNIFNLLITGARELRGRVGSRPPPSQLWHRWAANVFGASILAHPMKKIVPAPLNDYTRRKVAIQLSDWESFRFR